MMGVWYYVVNIQKREKLSASPFGDHEKTMFASSNQSNLQLMAIRWMLVPTYWEAQGQGDCFRLRGSWQGDSVYTISDHDELLIGDGDDAFDPLVDSSDISYQVFLELIEGCDAFRETVFDVVREEKTGCRELLRTVENIEIGSLSDHLRFSLAGLLETKYLSLQQS